MFVDVCGGRTDVRNPNLHTPDLGEDSEASDRHNSWNRQRQELTKCSTQLCVHDHHQLSPPQ